MTEKYLYLSKTLWVDSWVNGGRVPLNLASTYKRMERSGIYTPDENLIYESTVDLNRLMPALQIEGNVKNLSIGKVIINGQVVAENVKASKYEEDGIILSLCNRKARNIAERLNKVACVRILDVEFLKSIIDEQLGIKGVAMACKYTAGYKRNHFLKSDKDQWQDEFRIFWAYQQRAEVNLPRGVATRIKL